MPNERRKSAEGNEDAKKRQEQRDAEDAAKLAKKEATIRRS